MMHICKCNVPDIWVYTPDRESAATRADGGAEADLTVASLLPTQHHTYLQQGIRTRVHVLGIVE